MAKKITRATLDEQTKEMAPHSEQKSKAHFGGAVYDGSNRRWRPIACMVGLVFSALLCSSLAYGGQNTPLQSCDTLELNALDSIDSFDQIDGPVPASRLSSKFRYSDGLPKDFREIFKQYNLSFKLGEHFELLYPELLYPFGDENRKSYLAQNLGTLRGRIRHKSGKWEVYTKIEARHEAYIGKPTPWEDLQEQRMAAYIADNFSWGKRYTSITEQEKADLLMLIRKHPDEQARKYFNAQELYSIPLNFGRERLGEGFHCGKMYWIYKDGQMFSLFIMSSEPAPVDCDKYLAELDGMFRF